jgi:putative FmdB family regulatory protein
MPLYEYQCRACGHRFERIQKFSDPPVGECPSCQGAVEKLLSSPAIQFKGSGWYITDYAKSGKSSADGKPASTTESTSGTTSEAKTDKSDASKSATESAPKPAAPTSDSK